MSAADQQFTAALIPAGIPPEAWQATIAAAGEQPDEITRSWLSEDGLLTRRLRNQCGPKFAMRVLHDEPCTISAGLHREVLLCCGSQACVYAITDVPPGTLAAHRWLAELGDEPLGESLQGRSDVSRTDFNYALLNPGYLPVALAASNPVWARRSEFVIGTDALSVTEIFLDGLAACSSPP